MKKFLKWFGRMLVRDKPAAAPRRRPPAARISPGQPYAQETAGRAPQPPAATVRPNAAERPSENVATEIDDGGPGKNVLVRSRYVREETGTHDILRIIDPSVLETETEKGGFDPYNTGRFDRSDYWKSRTRQ